MQMMLSCPVEVEVRNSWRTMKMELMIHRSDECNSDEISGNNFISSGVAATAE